jgi:hypothetical protein
MSPGSLIPADFIAGLGIGPFSAGRVKSQEKFGIISRLAPGLLQDHSGHILFVARGFSSREAPD